jgi:hypothetical protein
MLQCTIKPDEELRGGVYKIRCLENGKEYIGVASILAARYHTQASMLISGSPYAGRLLLEDYQQYGAGAFVFEVVQVEDDSKERLRICNALVAELMPAYNAKGVKAAAIKSR